MDDTDTARNAASRAGSAEVKAESPGSNTTAAAATVNTKSQYHHQQSAPPKRTVCDHCRRRRIRCDGKFPCEQCVHASLTCKREHVPKKRGPKRGHGRVINELRARESSQTKLQRPQVQKSFNAETALESPTDVDIGMSGSDLGEATSQHSSNASAASTPPSFWAAVTSNPGHGNVPEPGGMFSSDELRPRTRSYFHMIPQLVELYYEHIYPIMPLIYMPTVRETINRPMAPSEKNLIYALCALTSMHMSGKSIGAPGPTSWEVVGRFFLDETISTRQTYDFLEDLSLSAVISSFYLSTSFFEINQSRKSWYYLREALTNAQDLGLQDDSTYYGLSCEETLCRQRVFWILFVTERSFAILRNKPITFKRTPSLPTTRHPYEGPDIHAGFLQLVSSYTPLDESFVTAWNEGSDPRISATTFLALQNLLSLPPAFLRPHGRSSPTQPHGQLLGSYGATSASRDANAPEPTDIQKADLLITQQWLRLIVWQSSMRQGLLSWTDPADSGGGVSSGSGVGGGNSMCFSFPLTVARDTASILSSLPSKAVEVHGMGIMEKIFEIGTWCVNVLGACESVGFSTTMDFTSGDMGVLGSGRKGASLDPIEFFVRTLSASDNSRKQFAEKLLTAAGENPGSMRTQLSPAMSGMSSAAAAMIAAGQAHPLMEQGWGQQQQRGSVVGEVFDDSEENSGNNQQQQQRQRQQQQQQQQLDLGSNSMQHPSGIPNMGLGIDLGADRMTRGMGGVDLDASSVDLMSPLGLTRSNTSDMAAMGMPGFDTAWSPSSGGTGPREYPDHNTGPYSNSREETQGFPDMGSGILMHERMATGAGGPIGGPVGGENSALNPQQQQQHQQGDDGGYDVRRPGDKNGGYPNGGRVGLWLGT
ncbi:fungal specific transcription factor domain-containing protein [Colletotrichum orchidophilum]|uniref:Fungal specific transcription factor domain-containing protein n=1 Tax=Colletotrichum orchidophilum TaxID=1209926 RepID=A0A1G4AP26_9PEZI|nr:fungal specific transcription factor domain-containing protein [Colletotrichum orchidophilum]OHE90940.1 fungal specific transcription factor domain-containing protein [Colletotrichum orchidophilum]